jgi:hypothetical protein
MNWRKKNGKKKEMWGLFGVTMDFNYRICGSVPLSKKIVPLWLESRMPKVKPDNAKPIEEIKKEVEDSIEESIEQSTLGFQQDTTGLFVRGGTIKAHLKDCANQIKDFVGVKVFRAKLANMVYIQEYAVYIKKNGAFIQESDGSYEQPVHVFTRQGPRNALKIINFVERPTLQFTMLIMDNKEVTIDEVNQVFAYGSVHGYGGERGMGEGRYSFKIEKI